jgi:hypothetical protein
MTQLEAEDRASNIWPGVFSVEQTNDDPESWLVTIWSENGPLHRFDANGHPTCHQSCAEMEAERLT